MDELRVYEVIGSYPRTSDKCPATIVAPQFRDDQKRYLPKTWAVRHPKSIALLKPAWSRWWLGDLVESSPELGALTEAERDQYLKAIRSFVQNGAGGPTQGYNRPGGDLKLNVVTYLGQRVLGCKMGDGWTRLETLDVNDLPPIGMTHESAEWFIPRVTYQRFWQISGPPIQLGGNRDLVPVPFASDHRKGFCYLPDYALRLVLKPGELRVLARLGVNVREAPSIAARKITALPYNSIVTVQSTAYVDGNIWAEIGPGLYICLEYNGQTLVG